MKKTRILIVEDENIVALDIEQGLVRRGYEVPAVTDSGESAIRLSGLLKPDLILMDIQLKGEMDGIAAAARIRDLYSIPVLFLSANSDEATLQRSKGSEPVGYVLKPFDEQELHTAIEITLHKYKAQEQILHRTEEQLRQAQKMEAIGRLAGGVAHDFNNILSVILSYSDMLMENLRPGEPMRNDLEEIQKAGIRAASLTRQLLAFSRQQVLEPRNLNLNEVMIGIEKMLKRMMGEDVQMRFFPKADLDICYVDPGQIEQVLMNLVVNARDAMPQGGQLTIETSNIVLDEPYVAQHPGSSVGAHVVLSVTDTGTGMDKDTQLRIFEPFFTTKPVGEGTGLGLSTVYGIVKQSGGSVWVYSEVGQGTTFKIYFPRSLKENTEVPAAKLSGSKSVGTETVLLVEDEDQVRTLMSGILKRAGYHVLEANNGGEALLICEQHGGTIHLLLTDVVMPRMNGRQLSDRLIKLRPDLRVLFISGYTKNAIIHHGMLDSGIHFLSKPITPEPLLRKVRQVLDIR
jgi:two-component system cell cycle sensor histidine kinase/response regulator CckA